jgi:REP element-mobilizing transposase RayT
MHRHPIRKNIRLPLPVYDQSHAFSITIATHDKHPWFHLHPDLSKAAIPIMRNSASAMKIKIYAWCLMPDHVHFLLQGKGVVDLYLGKPCSCQDCQRTSRICMVWIRSLDQLAELLWAGINPAATFWTEVRP